ncbi:MAG: M14 family metallopeptidase, partial [Gemmatimonadota bacterium]
MRRRHPDARFALPATVLLLSASLLVVPGAASAQRPTATDTTTRDARDVFVRGWLLQDRNADDVVDFVDARILLPRTPSAAEAIAAANIAARLGYETSGVDLDLAAAADGAAAWPMPVLVVRDLGRAGTASPLAPGEGALVRIPVDANHAAGGLRVEGADATGLLATAAFLSSRYPKVWSLDGASFGDVADRLTRFLARNGAPGARVLVERIVVSAARPGVARVQVDVQLADTVALRRAADALGAERTDTAAAAGAAGAPARATRTGAAQDSARPVRRSDLDIQDLDRIDVRLIAEDVERVVRLLPRRPWTARVGTAWTGRDIADFSLSDLYTIRGLYRDTNRDRIPDRTEAWLAVGSGAASGALVDLAMRIGLETAGMRLPFAAPATEDDHPESAGFPIVHGLDTYAERRLNEEGKLHAATPEAGTGFIEFVRRGFSGRNGIVIGGADARGLEAVTEYVAGRMPWLWEPGKGNWELADVETEVRRFFQAREAPGQVALAIHKLDTWLDRLEEKDIDSLAVEIATRESPDGLRAFALARLRSAFPSARAAATTFATGFGVDREVFTQDFALPWEVDTVRAALRARALPRITGASQGRIEVRVSEPPEVRARLADEIRAELAARGVADGAFDVHVLSAYKQGYSWLYDVVLPQLRGKRIGRIEITYHNLKDSKEVRWQSVASDTRWLQEIYPIDAVFAKELGIPDSTITFTPTFQAEPTYRIRVLDRSDREILTDTFDPKYVIRPYFDLFPEYDNVRVTTGWVRVDVDGETVLDRRVRTDPEAFWDRFQTETYGRIIDYVMDVQDGRVSPANAPYFDALRVDLSMSEPDYRIGIDEEVISSLEAMHEDIYFETLTLFDLIGNRYGVGPLNFAGRVLPWIEPGNAGRPGHARITFTGKQRGVPELVLTWRERGKEPVRDRYPLSALPASDPKLRALRVRAGEDGVSSLLFEVAARDSVDRYEAMRERGTEQQIDRTLLPVPMLTGMVRALAALHADGVLLDAMSFDRIARLDFRFIVQDTASRFSARASLARSRAPRSTRNPVLLAQGWKWDGGRMVQWDTPIPPAESDSILARLATFPGVDVYYLTTSFLGHGTFAADILPPQDAKYISQAKLNALKPTVVFSGRQHANEVSSTSHILRLGERLVTDTTYAKLLRRVNVVLHPITNPDGAELAYAMQRINPDFMLHAGYLGALGVDATSGSTSADPIYPESKARPELQETWLPDVFMNMHGYPSHEWVQYFAGYSAWVRGRSGTQRSWWAPRGWFVPGFSWLDDNAHPEFEKAQFALLDSIAASITSDSAVAAMNRRLYARYAKYGRQDIENFREDFVNGILVYRSLRGRGASGGGPGSAAGSASSPRIGWFSITTEAPDETARGDWLELVAWAG